MQRILVIKLSALGDFVLAFGPIQAIRRVHSCAQITLLTTPAFETLAKASGLVDDVWIDNRPKLWQVGALLALRRQLREARFDRVYDLQTSNRTAWYYKLLGNRAKPEWSGTVAGCSHPHRDPERDRMHLVEAQAAQLAETGIVETPLADLSWWQSDIKRLKLPPAYAVILPGGAAHRPEKRWPADRFAAIAGKLAGLGLVPVLVGGASETSAAVRIEEACPNALNLVGRTELMDLAPVMRRAAVVVGNDTGPMHVAALVGRPCVVLFGAGSDPALSRPRAPCGAPEPVVLRARSLAELSVEAVWTAVEDALR